MGQYRIVDTHAHLHDQEFKEDFNEVLRRAWEAGVERIVLIGENLPNSEMALKRAETKTTCWATVGVHPHHAKDFSATTPAHLRQLATANHEKVVAIGEIGLDFHYDFSTPRDQEIAFRSQVELALQLKLPIVVHCREAYDLMLKILAEYAGAAETKPWGVMHCYFGTVEQAWQFYEMGLQLGIGGAATFKKAEVVHEVVRELPLEALVLETDAPYMAPVPYRGKRNEPSFLPLVVERIAQLKDLSPADVAEATTQNAYRLFRWQAV